MAHSGLIKDMDVRSGVSVSRKFAKLPEVNSSSSSLSKVRQEGQHVKKYGSMRLVRKKGGGVRRERQERHSGHGGHGEKDLKCVANLTAWAGQTARLFCCLATNDRDIGVSG